LLPKNLVAREKNLVDVLAARLKAGSGYFGRAVLQRTSPDRIKEVLDVELEYASEVHAIVDRAQIEENLKSLVLAATSSPRLKSDLLCVTS